MRLLPIVSIGLIAPLFLMPEAAQAQRRKKKAEEPVSIYNLDSLKQPIPRQRELFHSYIDKEQRRVDISDGAIDQTVYYAEDTVLTNLLTKALLTDINQMQVMIENLPVSGDAQAQNQTKIRYLTAVRNLLQRYNRDVRVDPYAYRRQVTNLREMLIARTEGNLDAWAREHATMATVENSELLHDVPEAKNYVFGTVGRQYPKVMLRRLNEFSQEPFACDIIAAAAQVVPNEVYSYATTTNYNLRQAVRNCSDPLVQTIVSIGNESKSALKVMPFLTEISSGAKTIAQVDKIAADPDTYFKALVELRMKQGGALGESNAREVQYRALRYVRTMNDLHDSPDPVRFRIVDGFTPEQLYYVLVYGQDELYTSSYLGVFKRMMERMKGKQNGEQLLESVKYDRFRTFIRLAANYNTLEEFLNTLEKDRRLTLMKSFMSNLEEGSDDDLEAAVDVADAYSAIEDFALAKLLTAEVQSNYERTKALNSKKGIIVYGLLSALFNGGVEGDELGLPPVNRVPYRALTNDSGVVYQQVYFYGDEDGKVSFAGFLPAFRNNKWKISTEKYWTRIASTSGKPVVIYANNPLSEPADEEAQKKLREHLDKNNIHPTVIIHRGHSYHLPLTIDGLQKETKIVMLGSCGGYHNLGTVIENSPDAQIISTKQTGTMSVNEPIIQEINEKLLAGKDIEWPAMWRDLGQLFGKKGGEANAHFKDYVPPHKNLGALFIKAYRKVANATES